MIHLLAATRNAHKTPEIQMALGREFEVRDLSGHPEIPEIVESGATFEENATIKALAVSQRCEGLVIADDSGLEVDALDGAPGIFSARYAGENATDQENIEKLHRELQSAASLVATGLRPIRTSHSDVATKNQSLSSARFRCVIALARGDKVLKTFTATIEGSIITTPRGSNGFGYDPIFVPTGFEQTFGEISDETKSRISHRAKALQQLRNYFSPAVAR